MAKSADAFRTISEVAEWLDTPAHVLRFWESRFTQVKPVKRAGGRRYYRPNDMLLLGGIKKLLHEDGMTIKGAQKLLRTDGVKKVSAMSQALDAEDRAAIDLEAIEVVNEPSSLSIVASDESETVPEPTPVAALDPEPEVALDPAPKAAPDPEPDVTVDPTSEAAVDPEPEVTFTPAPEVTSIPDAAPSIAAELEPEQPDVAIPTPEPIAEPLAAPQAIVEAQPSASDTTDTVDVSAQLSSIYSRLTALHDRMKDNIDPKQQG